MQRHEDHRGYFARTFCRETFNQYGLELPLDQFSLSYNHKRGTLRGLHYQQEPHAEIKLVRCTRGSLFDVIVDLRPQSPTYRSWTAVELSEDRPTMVYIPRGCAHGFITLEDQTELFYQIGGIHHGPSSTGIRYDDPSLAIPWPLEIQVISSKDLALPLLT